MECFYYQLLQTFLTHLTGNKSLKLHPKLFFPLLSLFLKLSHPAGWKPISGVQSKLLQSFAPLTVFSSGCYHLLSPDFVTFAPHVSEDLLSSGCHWCSPL